MRYVTMVVLGAGLLLGTMADSAFAHRRGGFSINIGRGWGGGWGGGWYGNRGWYGGRNFYRPYYGYRYYQPYYGGYYRPYYGYGYYW